MDIIDIMLAKAMTPQGKTDAYVNKANNAAQRAAQAAIDAETAVATVENAADEIATAREEAAALLEEAQEVLETAQDAQINLPEAYNETGQNTDGYMTQKATTDALALKADISSVNNALAEKADKTYVDNAIAQGGGSGSGVSISFSPEDAGYLTKVDDDGDLAVSNIHESALFDALIRSGAYITGNAVGLDIDYENRVFTRTQMAADSGFSFNSLSMYGGRRRCNVSDDGTITAFEGDSNYRIDGSNGQVMVYQPKFYYKRVPITLENNSFGTIARHEQLILSSAEQSGFKLAPIFGDELEYVLLPAFEGSIANDKMQSIANVAPATNITIDQAEAYANARGEGWHITNMAAESTNQMLFIVEYGTMNSQTALGAGISNAQQIQNTNSQSAITYRGMENPWGNRWRMIGGVNLLGNGNTRGGEIYICTNYNYTPASISGNYESVGFTLPSNSGWLNAMGYSEGKYDWVYMPIECSSYANSLVPIGDNLWTVANTTQNKIVAIGGPFNMQEYNGLFYYACDRGAAESSRSNFGASLMFIPMKNQIYFNNLSKAGG